MQTSYCHPDLTYNNGFYTTPRIDRHQSSYSFIPTKAEGGDDEDDGIDGGGGGSAEQSKPSKTARQTLLMQTE